MINPHEKRTSTRFFWLGAVAIITVQLVRTDLLRAQEPEVTPKTAPDASVSPEMARKAYMNCLLEVDKTGESLIGKGKAREAESKSQLQFCDNRKKDCSANLNSPECRTFIEEFASE